jgi:hypothetical protein
MTMHPKLIEANKAFFAGDRAETSRLLEEYRQSYDTDWELLQWLEAHSQSEHEQFMTALQLLVEQGEANNQYVQMAKDYLNEENEYQAKISPRPKSRRSWSTILGAGSMFALGLIVAFFAISYFNSGANPETIVVTATPDPLLVAPTLALEDRSQPLFGEIYTARYASGVLEITAIEDRSQRIVERRTDTVISAVPGARFVALSIVFECRSGICREPPEAELFLRLDNDELIPRRTDVYISGDLGLQAVALGRTTEGWMIFEVPALNRAESLIIRPPADESGTAAAPISIDLPAF